MIVLDASIVVEWLLGEHSSGAKHLVDTLPDVVAIAPCHWPLEISNALRTHLKSGDLSANDFHAVMNDLDKLNVRVEAPIHPDEIGPLVQFSVDHDLTAYDASYVQLAVHHQAVLVTLDNAMRRAAGRLNVAVLPT